MEEIQFKPNELVIILKDIHSVPKVYHRGVQVDLKQAVSFEWETQDLNAGKCKYRIRNTFKDKNDRTYLQDIAVRTPSYEPKE